MNEHVEAQQSYEAEREITYTLLEDAGHDTTGLCRAVFQGCGRCVSVQTAHGNAEQRATGEELLVGVAESGSLQISAMVSFFFFF